MYILFHPNFNKSVEGVLEKNENREIVINYNILA